MATRSFANKTDDRIRRAFTRQGVRPSFMQIAFLHSRTRSAIYSKDVSEAIERMSQQFYKQFVSFVVLHRRLINLVDQRVGREKAILRRTIAALQHRIATTPDKDDYFVKMREEAASQWQRPGVGTAATYSRR